MKVIKKGRDQNGWAKEFTCTAYGNGDNGCGAILLVEEDDVKYTGSKHSYGDTYADHFNGFLCPECGCVTDFKDSDRLPNRIIKKVGREFEPNIKKKVQA